LKEASHEKCKINYTFLKNHSILMMKTKFVLFRQRFGTEDEKCHVAGFYFDE
jgi:hypothetical protein